MSGWHATTAQGPSSSAGSVGWCRYLPTMTENAWPRDCYTGPGGGLYTGPGGGMYTGPGGGAYTGPEGGAYTGPGGGAYTGPGGGLYTGPGGGAYTGPGGGLYTGPGGGAYTGPGEPYMRNWPPIPMLIHYLDAIGLAQLAATFRKVRGL